ncbi:hypothetical protein PC111_g9110 [Phytophthora cactorum]|nr:hypothetical protein PC111_g9110 [Phytophthora cactorum]
MSLFALVGKQSTDLTATHKAAALLLHQNEYAVQRSALRRSFDLPPYRWASEDRDEELQRGDVRAASTKEATEIKSALESYLRENYQFTFGSPGLQHEYFNVYHQPPPPRPDLHPLSR